MEVTVALLSGRQEVRRIHSSAPNKRGRGRRRLPLIYRPEFGFDLCKNLFRHTINMLRTRKNTCTYFLAILIEGLAHDLGEVDVFLGEFRRETVEQAEHIVGHQ